MSFTNPAALWLLFLLPLPLLLSRRRPRTRRVVSNAFLWHEAAHRAAGQIAARRRRVTTRLLVQIACIGALVLTLAGPVFTLNAGRTALVFDVSASMGAAEDGGMTRLDAARARARTIVMELPQSTRVRVILAGVLPRQLGEWGASDTLLSSAIDTIEATAGAADIKAAVALAGAPGDGANIIVFSDTQTSTAEAGFGSSAVQYVRIGRAVDNAAVTRIAAWPTELGSRAGTVLVTLHNYGTSVRDADLEIATDGRIAQHRHVELPPGGTLTLGVELPDLGRLLSATLAGKDALPIDDSRSVAVATSTVRVALVGLRGSFLERALAVNPSVSVRRYEERLGIPALPSTDSFDVLVCGRCTSPSDSSTPSIRIVDGSGDPIRAAIRVVNTVHPISQGVDPGGQHATVTSSQLTSEMTEVVLRVGSVPAVAAVERQGQRHVVIHRDLTESEFVLSPAFPVLVANAIGWLAAGGRVPGDVTAGEPLVFALPTTSGGGPRVTGPDGRRRAASHAGAQYIVADTGDPGPYRVEANGSERLVAVNPDVGAESDLLTVEDASVEQTDEPTAIALRARTDAASWVALVAVALLALDWRLWMRSV